MPPPPPSPGPPRPPPSPKPTGPVFVLYDIETFAPAAFTQDCIRALGITEFAAVRFRLRETEAGFVVDVEDTYSSLVRHAHVDAYTTHITGISTALMEREGAKPLREVMEAAFERLDGAVWVGHNITKFDNVVLLETFKRLGMAVPRWTRLIDTLSEAQRGLPKPDVVANHKLGTLATHFGLSSVGAHRALADCMMNLGVFLGLLNLGWHGLRLRPAGGAGSDPGPGTRPDPRRGTAAAPPAPPAAPPRTTAHDPSPR